MSLDHVHPYYESSAKLCAAIKKHICLYDPICLRKGAPPECDVAWELVAEECNETIEFCKNRWKSLRKSFFQGLRRRGSKYYLHNHMDFILKKKKKKSKRQPDATLNDETNSLNSDSLQQNFDDEMETINIYDEDEDANSVSSQTTSADESLEVNNHSSQVGEFIINEIELNEGEMNKDLMDERRLSYKRSCKRGLDPELINEMIDETYVEPEEKRSRKLPTEKRKSLTDKVEKVINSQSLSYPVRMDKLKINLTENKVETIRPVKMIDRFTFTELNQTREFGTQYEITHSLDLDETFLQCIKSQLPQMNSRQKMNFKRKIYQSLLEVFDDSADFPGVNESLPLINKQIPPHVGSTTVGELRLMRELVTLVQAAKTTPEIMNAKETVKISEHTPSKSLPKMPTTTAVQRSKAQTSPHCGSKTQTSPLSLSPSPDDDDLQFSLDNIDDEDDGPLPRTWDEIKAKVNDSAKPASADNVMGLPRRILQKVVRVSGASGSTIVAREGDRKRIYRIYPKTSNQTGSHAVNSKNESNVGTFYVGTAKGLQDTAANKSNCSSPNITIRSFNNKNTNDSTTTVNRSYQATNAHTSSNNSYNNETIFKGVHPANRILDSTTGLFKMVSTPKNVNLNYTQKTSGVMTVPTTKTGISSTVTKVFATKNPMMPPTSASNTKRTQITRPQTNGAQIIQRRYSVCVPVSETAGAFANSNAANAAKTSAQPNKSNTPPIISSVSQIQISQPISLNIKAVNSQFPTAIQSNFSNNNAITAALAEQKPDEDVKVPIKSLEDKIDPMKPVTSASNAKTVRAKTQEIPILETAGIVEADSLDPLFVKQPNIKSEPVDD